MPMFKVLINVAEEREYHVESTSAGAAEAELDSLSFKVTERDISYTSAYPIKPENED
jgi:hypothetical protein